MRHKSFFLSVLATTVVLATGACMPHRNKDSNLASTHGASRNEGYKSQLVKTTYFGGNRDRTGPGPGNFACMSLQHEKQWYVAPSDTFGDPDIWDAGECQPNANGVPDCTRVMQEKRICGRKVKIKCGDNCRDDAPEIVLMITDACPKNHKYNVQSSFNSNGACQGGPAFDISQAAWEKMHQRDDNISVFYQRVDDSTPLGPVTSSAKVSGGDLAGELGSDGRFYPFCTNGSNTGGGFGWQPELGGPNGGSCMVPKQASTSAPTTSSTGSGSLSAYIQVKSNWQDGYCADIIIENKGSAATTSWTLQLNTNGSKITQTWNLTGDTSGSNLTFKPVAEWAGKIPAGGSSNAQGFCVQRSGSDVSINSVSGQ